MALARSMGIGKANILGLAPTLEISRTFSLTQTANMHYSELVDPRSSQAAVTVITR